MRLRGLFLLCNLVFLNAPSPGQTDQFLSLKDAVTINKFSSPVTFDGNPGEEAWNSLTPFKMTMHLPVYGKEPTEETDVRIGYDDKYLYIGARLFYKDPGIMRSASLKRDYMGNSGDWFGVILDSYNDKENGMGFFTSPDALRWDATIQKDAVLQSHDQIPVNNSWNTFWDVKTTLEKTGWSLEMRIPFSSLRFQEIKGEVRMGLILHRWIPAKNERDLYPAIPPNWGPVSIIKPSQAQEIVFHGIKPSKPVYIAPYALAGIESNYDLNNAGDVYKKSSNPTVEAGLDIKYGLSNNMIMDLTANTDFAQVEADDQQINLTRYSLYFPEKRTFFLERASVFDYALGGNSNLFYSRRIGLSDDGDPIRIYGGARITGRVGKWDMGVLDMQTAALWKENSSGEAEEVLPSENFGVLRFRRQIINDNTYVGAMMTSRLGVDGSYNLAYGLDGLFRVFGDDYLDLKWSQSFEDSVTNRSITEPTRIAVRWERRSSLGLGYNFGYGLSGIHYNPGIGFEMQNDYSSFRGGLKYGWLPGENSAIYSHSPEIMVRYMNYIDDGSIMSLNLNGGWTFLSKSQWEGNLSLVYNIESLRDSLELKEDEIFIMPSEYRFVNIMGALSTPATNPLFLMVKTETGQYFDGIRFSINLQPTWNISKHMEMGAIYNFDWLKFNSRNQEMVNHIIGIKALYMLDTRLSINAYIQYNTAVNGILTNLRLRYNPKEGNDFYIVFNEGRNTDLTREVPNLPVYDTRSVLLKYTYTFNF